jgi:hypothetical protein
MMALLEMLVLLDPLDLVEHKVSMDLLVHKVMMALRALLDPPVHKECVAHQAPMD